MEPEVDALAHLEERIRKATDLVAQLRSERDAARMELAELRKTAGAATEQSTALKEELESLRGERKQVRIRIEKLLVQMDQMSA